MWALGVLLGLADAAAAGQEGPVPTMPPVQDEARASAPVEPSAWAAATSTAGEPVAAEANRSVAKPLPRSQRPEYIQRYLEYYLEMYTGHLKSGDWMARAMGVISLGRIDDPRATENLLGVMKKDAHPLVRVYAWEALHGRQGRLDLQQRAAWVTAAWQLFDQNLFRGELRQGLVGLLEEGGPTDLGRRRFLRLFETTNAINSADIRTLHAMGNLLGRWRDPGLIRKMIEAMGTLNDAYRAEVVLARAHAGIPASGSLRMESSDTMWSTTGRRWADWYAQSGWQAIEPNQARKYAALSRIMPPGEAIRDTNDPKWKRDLELRKFRLDQLDVGIALDTTASMEGPLEWVKRDVVKMMRMFDLISREPRIGVTLFRDHGDQYLTKSFPLTGNADAMAAALRNEGCGGGGDVPEAAYDALVEVVSKQRWSTATRSKKVVVLISDAPPHEQTLPRIEELVKAAAGKGFLFYTVKVRTSKYVENALKLPNYDRPLVTFDRIAEWGGGKSVWVEFANQSASGRWQSVSPALDEEHSPRVIFRDVLKFVLEGGYRDRVDPFVSVLVEYIEEPLREVREAFEEAGPSHGSGGPPSDPQERR